MGRYAVLVNPEVVSIFMRLLRCLCMPLAYVCQTASTMVMSISIAFLDGLIPTAIYLRIMNLCLSECQPLWPFGIHTTAPSAIFARKLHIAVWQTFAEYIVIAVYFLQNRKPIV